MIAPTVGRIVWFHPGSYSRPFSDIHRVDQPMAAIVVRVWTDRMVNLAVFDHAGMLHPVTSVRLLQDDELPEAGQRHCQWMPYQKGQAAKAEALEAAKEVFDIAPVSSIDSLTRIGPNVRLLHAGTNASEVVS